MHPIRCCAIIPARGGSKGVPRKNVARVGGLPLLAWSLRAARAAMSVECVVVSTDDPEIAALATAEGARVVNRPAELASDTASSESALLHALDELEARGEPLPDLVAFLQCTSPLVTSEDVDQAVRVLQEEGADCCLTVTPFPHFLWHTEAGGRFQGLNHDPGTRSRRQDRSGQFLENGAVYVFRTEGFRRAGHRFFGRIARSVMPPERSLEVDSSQDLVLADTLLRRHARGKAAASLPRRVDAVVFDFDGVMTDNRVWVAQDGTETVSCDRSDGWGVGRLLETGIRVAVLSTEENPVVEARCRKLGIECHAGLGGAKRARLETWCAENQIDPEHLVFVGNDENDLGCLRYAGCAVVPADAHPIAREAAAIVLEHGGGRGAVREVCDLVRSAARDDEGVQGTREC